MLPPVQQLALLASPSVMHYTPPVFTMRSTQHLQHIATGTTPDAMGVKATSTADAFSQPTQITTTMTAKSKATPSDADASTYSTSCS